MTKQKKVKVYLAGKITNNHWRNQIMPSLWGRRNDFETISCGEDKFKTVKDAYYNYEYVGKDYIITGPHSIGCDHGCWHRQPHASVSIGFTEDACMLQDGSSITPKDVHVACCYQIKKSDCVFAYIDSLECYGTFAEIGYAYAKGKKIYILYSTPALQKELWFISQMATKVYYSKDIINAFKEMINENK